MGLELNIRLLKQAAIRAGGNIHECKHYSENYWQADWGTKITLRFWDTVPEDLPLMSQRMVNDKIAARVFIPQKYQTKYVTVFDNSVDDIDYYYLADHVPFGPEDRYVVKPVNSGRGQSVFTNLVNPEQIVQASAQAKANGFNRLMLEQQVPGNDYRLFVIGDKVVAALQRNPAAVYGDGESTINELIDIANEKRNLNPYTADKPIQRLSVGDATVPPKGRRVQVSNTANMSTGASSCSVTDILHPDIAKLAVNIHKETGLPYSGIDVIAPDIAENTGIKVLEINAIPDFAMHHYPMAGDPVKVADQIISYLLSKKT